MNNELVQNNGYLKKGDCVATQNPFVGEVIVFVEEVFDTYFTFNIFNYTTAQFELHRAWIEDTTRLS